MSERKGCGVRSREGKLESKNEIRACKKFPASLNAALL